MEENKNMVFNNRLIAIPESIISGSNYRITVLTERLVRLEYHPSGVFHDYRTQWVSFRNFEKPEFEVQQDDKYLVIKTKYFTLSYTKNKPFDGGKLVPTTNLKVDLNGTDKTWYYHHPEVKNYKGLLVGMDGSEEDLRLRNGLYSLDGFATIDDSNSYVYNDQGQILKRNDPGIDLYLFMYGKDFSFALKDYFTLTGMPPMIPRYALGNWWCRDLDYTETDILNVVANFERSEIPLAVFLLDKGWHKPNFTDRFMVTGYTFHSGLIPNPKELIDKLHEKNIKVGLHYDPIDGIFPDEACYSQIAQYFKITDNRVIAFDPLNPVLLNAIYHFLLTPLRALGVDFFWNDYKKTDHGLDSLWFINQRLFYHDKADLSKRSMILARTGMIAPHLQPIIYTGKTLVGWEMLRKISKFNQCAANMGVSWISHDVNGNFGGVEEEELYIRSIQLATFSPILRFHAPRGRYYRREPWRWNAKTLEIATQFLQLRHQMIPYTYSNGYRYHKEGVPIISPLYYEYPWIYDDKNYSHQYFFGEMLVAPIVEKKDLLMNRTVHRFFIPDGVWYDFKTGKKFPGNKEYVSFFRDEDYPVFVSRGGIIPLSILEEENFTGIPKELEIHVFPGKSNSFNLYEDDGISEMYLEGRHVITQIDYNYLPNNYTIIIRTLDGGRGIIDDYRDYKIRFRNTKRATDIVAYFNNTPLKTISYIDEADFVVEVKEVPSIGQLTINCKGKDIEIDAIRLINDDIDSILLDLPINTVLKEKISAIMFGDLPLKQKRIEIRKLGKFNLTKEYIRLFLRLLEYISQI
ncbi:MAG: glycoside hydrolase family 31 protein [bacterium]|nr:glycoside hydrolase family 31 protein [bacterium]